MNKNFETVKIREIDQETNDIMNEIGRENNLLTGSSIVIKGLKERNWYKMKYEAESEIREIENRDNKAEIRELKSKVREYETIIDIYKQLKQKLENL